ncbi:MAG: OmpA family protein, partial [bacterium]|nr:OmpA family protein [bacterium]
SDLMSAIVLVFVLILFYCMYQYFDMLEVKTAELLRQSGLLDEQQAALTQSEQDLSSAQAALDQKQSELDAQSQKLSEAEQASLAQQAKLLLQEQTLAALQDKLNQQESQLAAQQSQLDEATRQQQATQAQLENQQVQLDKLVGVRAELVSSLINALAASNLSGASVDDSGAIVFDTSMMFDTNKYTLKDVGKAFLDSFIPSYLSVLMSEEYAPYVSQIIIEGHTDTSGSFLNNMTLSQNRANAVLAYILSDEFTGVPLASKKRLEQIVTVNGRSYSDPVYRADGTVDMNASRRVVIKFRMNDEEMVNQMLELLSQNAPAQTAEPAATDAPTAAPEN